MASKPHSVNDFSVHFIDCVDTIRVWRDGWVGDQFEVVTPPKFLHIVDVCKQLSIPLIDHTNDPD